MAEDDLSLVVLESACSQIRRTSKFPPTTAEVIKAIREQVELWEPRLNAIYGCENVVGLLRAELKAATEVVAAAEAERQERARIAAEKKRADDELRAQPLKAGDRVRHKSGGYDRSPGTVVGAGKGGFHVCFDKGRGDYVDAGSLERMIPGDYGFEIVEANRAAIEKRLTDYRRRLQNVQRPVVGDRVMVYSTEYSKSQGAGTVVFAGDVDRDGYDDGCTIQFDNGELGVNIMAWQLRRLLPGEAGFMFAIGDRVAHAKFGVGTVESVDGNKITVMFDAAGCKKVVASFLERAE
jgi:hypothetical protein